MERLPAGTVTFLFTDVEGSTALLDKLGSDAYARELARHRGLLRACFEQHRGVEVDTQGDAFFVAFSSARDAVAAAMEAQEVLTEGLLHARIGLHTGEALLTDDGYVGMDVHRAARIATVAHGGQVLLSRATRELLSDDEATRDLGMHRLKDLSAPERLYQLGDHEFPPLRSLHQTNLPIPTTPFLGREQELGEILGLLQRDDTRLVTLTGTGGTGKTRLALQASGLVADEYPDGVWWVSLAALRDPELVLETMAQALGAQTDLEHYVSDRSMLLLFDNFEHLVAAGSGVASLLASCPNLNVLVTSREPLHVGGEYQYAVPTLAQTEAVELFVERAIAVDPSFEPVDDVAQICRRLDDLPLAVELAAARVKALSAAQILERLERRLPLLTAGDRDAPERQRTLRATIEWSHNLLTAGEQQLFARLSVFSAGCLLEAAEQVAEADIETLQSLVDKSLVRHGGARYSMLETLREYAAERLERLGERDHLMNRSAEHLLALVERAVSTPGERDRLSPQLNDELNNVRTVIEWALERPEPALALRLARRAWSFKATPIEQARWLDEALRNGEGAPEILRVHALAARGNAAYHLADFEEALALCEQALSAYQRLGVVEHLPLLLLRASHSALALGDDERSRALMMEALRTSERNHDDAGIYSALHALGELESRAGNLDTATTLLERSALLAERAGDRTSLTHILCALGDLALAEHDLNDARAWYRKGLELASEVRLTRNSIYAVAGIAAVAAEAGEAESAGRLWGGLGKLERELGWLVLPHERAKYDERIGTLADTEAITFSAAVEQGRRMGVDEIYAYALEASL